MHSCQASRSFLFPVTVGDPAGFIASPAPSREAWGQDSLAWLRMKGSAHRWQRTGLLSSEDLLCGPKGTCVGRKRLRASRKDHGEPHFLWQESIRAQDPLPPCSSRITQLENAPQGNLFLPFVLFMWTSSLSFLCFLNFGGAPAVYHALNTKMMQAN